MYIINVQCSCICGCSYIHAYEHKVLKSSIILPKLLLRLNVYVCVSSMYVRTYVHRLGRFQNFDLKYNVHVYDCMP